MTYVNSVKSIRIQEALVKELRDLDAGLRIRVAELLDLLAYGESLGMHVSRPMPEITHGAHELRVKDAS